MLSVNKAIYEPKNIYNFIDASVNLLVNSIPGLTARKEYWLFYFVKDDFFANWSSLYNANIDQDFLGFPLIRRNTRHAIEAFLDLYNLCMDTEYMSVLEYCAHKHKNAGKYGGYLFHGQFSILSKCNIAKTYGEDFQFLLDISRESNDYIHPNVFVDIVSVRETDKKTRILKEVLNANVFLLTHAYELILKKFNQCNQPYLGCCNNLLCYQCYQMAHNRFKECLNNQLLMDINQPPIVFQ